jgi:hypothetical protein
MKSSQIVEISRNMLEMGMIPVIGPPITTPGQRFISLYLLRAGYELNV